MDDLLHLFVSASARAAALTKAIENIFNWHAFNIQAYGCVLQKGTAVGLKP